MLMILLTSLHMMAHDAPPPFYPEPIESPQGNYMDAPFDGASENLWSIEQPDPSLIQDQAFELPMDI